MDDKTLLGLCSEVLLEIERHQRRPIARGKVVVPLICPLEDTRKILGMLRATLHGAVTHVGEDNTFIEIGSVLIYHAHEALTNPVILRGDTALIYVMQTNNTVTKYAREVLMSTITLTLSTARFNGLGGHVLKY